MTVRLSLAQRREYRAHSSAQHGGLKTCTKTEDQGTKAEQRPGSFVCSQLSEVTVCTTCKLKTCRYQNRHKTHLDPFWASVYKSNRKAGRLEPFHVPTATGSLRGKFGRPPGRPRSDALSPGPGHCSSAIWKGDLRKVPLASSDRTTAVVRLLDGYAGHS